MDRKTRERILPHVEKLLQSRPRPSRETLYELLSLCTPDFSPKSIDKEVPRERAFRSLKACLHPDKHLPGQRDRVTKLFQSVQTYYTKGCQELQHSHHTSTSNSSAFQRPSKRSHNMTARTSSPNSVIQLDFDVFSQWSCLHQVVRETPFAAVSTTELYYHMAYQCLNLRGAIVHGQPIECTYQVPAHASTKQSLQEVWEEAGFPSAACRSLDSVQDIKDELTHHGPVISTSFQLEPAFYHSTRHAGNFSQDHIGHVHPLLLVGWTMTCHGEVWLVQGLRGPTCFPIGVGQFQIEAKCLAPPTALLECKSWQSPGPFWDVPYLADKCVVWKDHFQSSAPPAPKTGTTSSLSGALLEITPITSDELEALADLFHIGLLSLGQERRPFVLRDAERMAQSRRVILQDVGRTLLDNGKKSWKVTLQVLRK